MAPKLEKPSSLTVPLLRAELDKRGLATTGLKAELVARLTEAMEGRGGGGGEDDGDGDAEMVRMAALLNVWPSRPGFVMHRFLPPSDPHRSLFTRWD